MSADYVRTVAIILSAIAAAALPAAIGVVGRPGRTWLLLVSLELVWFGAIVAMGSHYGGPVAWYRTPLMIVASVLALAFTADRMLRR